MSGRCLRRVKYNACRQMWRAGLSIVTRFKAWFPTCDSSNIISDRVPSFTTHALWVHLGNFASSASSKWLYNSVGQDLITRSLTQHTWVSDGGGKAVILLAISSGSGTFLVNLRQNRQTWAIRTSTATCTRTHLHSAAFKVCNTLAPTCRIHVPPLVQRQVQREIQDMPLFHTTISVLKELILVHHLWASRWLN